MKEDIERTTALRLSGEISELRKELAIVLANMDKNDTHNIQAEEIIIKINKLKRLIKYINPA